jgi:hypothetical protein
MLPKFPNYQFSIIILLNDSGKLSILLYNSAHMLARRQFT